MTCSWESPSLRSLSFFYTTVHGVLPKENGSEITPPLLERLRWAIRQHLNKHLIGACREVFAHPLVYVAFGSPGHQPFRQPIAAVAREVLFAEALAEPAVAVVWQLHVRAQVGAGQPQGLLALARRGHRLLHD